MLSAFLGACAGARPPASPLRAPAPAQPAAALAFQHVTVIDVRNGQRRRDQTVLVAGNRVQAVGPARHIRVPPGARIVAAQGKYLIPGLWDMELVLDGAPDPFMWLLLANGVTGYRNLGQVGGGTAGRTTIDSMLTWRREIAAGTRLGPRLLIGGPAIDGVAQSARRVPAFLAAPTPARARALVDSLQAAGADHIFVYTNRPMRRDVVFALLAEARRRHIPVVGHLPDSLTLAEAADSGMRAVDHAYGTAGICFPAKGGMIWPIVASAEPPGHPTLERCQALAARLRRHNTWVALGPFYLWAAPSRLTKAEVLRRLRYAPRQFRPTAEDTAAGWLEPMQATNRIPRDFFTMADRAGLPVLLATDKGPADISIALRTPVGFQLHDDLAVAVEHGLSPLTALQAVTLNAAKYWEATDSLGAVEAGKLADLVLLDADPLADIYNIQRIQAVVANGRYFDRAALDSLLARAGAMVSAWP